jgi:hypothetical protein
MAQLKNIEKIYNLVIDQQEMLMEPNPSFNKLKEQNLLLMERVEKELE